MSDEGDPRLRTFYDIEDPLEAYYETKGGPFLFEVPRTETRAMSFNAFPLTPGTNHPYVRTLLAYAGGSIRSYDGSPLQRFYDLAQPKNFAEALGLAPEDASTDLAESPVISGVYPWSATDWRKAVTRGLALSKERDERFGPINSPTNNAGPSAPGNGQDRFLALTSLYESVRRFGYNPSAFPQRTLFDSHIVAHVLLREGEWRFLVGGGNHRAAVLSAMEWTRLPVIIMNTKRMGPALIRREDAGAWPLVRGGLFTVDQARTIFDRLFEGRQAPACCWQPD